MASINTYKHKYKKYYAKHLRCSIGVLRTALKRPKTLSGLDADYWSVGRLEKRMSKFATANCPYQTQPRTSVQLTVCAVL